MKSDDLCSGFLARCLGFFGEADEALEIVVQHALAYEGACALAEFQQTGRNEAAEGFVGGGTAGVEALGDLALREKFGTGHELTAAEELPQLFDQLLMKGGGSGHGGDFAAKTGFDKWLSQFRNWLSQSLQYEIQLL